MINRNDDDVNKILPIRRGVNPGQLTRLGDMLESATPDGPPPAHLHWQCPTCGPISPLFVPAGRGFWVRRMCECQKAAKARQEAVEQVEVWRAVQKRRTFTWLGDGWHEDPNLFEMTFDTFVRSRQPQGYLAAVKFAHNPEGNLAFEGGFGTGKTHLEAAICHFLREKGITSLFASATKLFAVYNDRISHDQDHWSIIKQAIATPVFVLDDVDKFKPRDNREEILCLIFDERAKARRPIVLSTNKMADLELYIGAAAKDRLMIGLQVAPMIGNSYREEL